MSIRGFGQIKASFLSLPAEPCDQFGIMLTKACGFSDLENSFMSIGRQAFPCVNSHANPGSKARHPLFMRGLNWVSFVTAITFTFLWTFLRLVMIGRCLACWARSHFVFLLHG